MSLLYKTDNKTGQQKLYVLLVSSISILAMSGCAKYKQQIASQSSKISTLEEENKGLKQEKESLLNDNSSLSAQKTSCDENVVDLQSKIADMESAAITLNEKIEALESEIEILGSGKIELTKDLAAKEAMLAEMRKEKALAKKRMDTMKNMLKKFKTLIAAGKLNVKIRNGKMVLELPSAILFESGKAELSEEGQKTLVEVAEVLSKIKNREFQVAGHTDSDPIKSSGFSSNWELSTSRALAVVIFLEKNKMNPKYLSAAGYSEHQPAESNKTDKGKSANRRIEITLMPNLDELPDLSDLEKELSK